MKIDYINISKRTIHLLLQPNNAWKQVLKEQQKDKDLFYSYLLPLVLVVSVLVFLISLFTHTILQSIGLSLINLISALCGTWCAYVISREYLCSKLNYYPAQALNLTVYSAAIFTIFHGIGTALDFLFIGQLFTLFSFVFIRTLYMGITQLPQLANKQKTNILVIMALSIICIPIIISQILMIVLSVSAINV